MKSSSAFLTCFLLLASPALAADKPNLIWIMADDLGYGELGCYGQKVVQTPCLDRMAGEGMRFTQFYSGATVCAPSRSVLMTGQHQGHTRVRGNAGKTNPVAQALRAEDVTVADVLHKAGYRTALIGKWGLGDVGDAECGLPRKHGFDYFFGYLSQHHAHNHFPDFLWRNEERVKLPNVVTPAGESGAGYATQAKVYADDLFAEESLKFVAENKDRPFFLYWSPVIPHANNERARLLGDGAHVPDYGPYADKDWPVQDKGHAAMITRLDSYVGRLLDSLNRLGLAEKTVVIFTSDNGPHKESNQNLGRFNPSGPLTGIKRSLTDGGIRVPFIAWWPGKVKAGGVNAQVGYFGDWMATAAELAGTQTPDKVDSLSLAPTLLGRSQAQKQHEFLYWEFHEGGFKQAALYQGRWKGIRSGGPQSSVALYDLTNDIGEKTDVAAQHPEILRTISGYLKTARSDSPDWKPSWPSPRKAKNRESRPNVVVFLADDAGWGDYGHSGNTLVRMPHIDSLAESGVSLDRFFVCPVCSPTRAEFLTGRYHARGGVRGVSTGQERLNLDEKTIADAFRAAGYATGAFGKWHNGSQWPYHPMARGFQEYFGHTAGHWGEYFNAPLEDSQGHIVRPPGYIVDVCTDRALAFIERNKSRPFFCYIPFTTPHSPWAAPEEYWRRFKDKPITQRATLPNQEDPDQTRCALAMLENQDWNVGRVLDALRRSGLEQNTIVLYFSDNGPNSWRWNGGMKGRKGSTDEGGVRSVCYVRWPGQFPAGHTVRQVAAAIDLLPTLTSLAGIARVGDKPLDGRDLSPLLKHEKTEWPDRMLFTAWVRNVSVRTQRYRLDNAGRLFDIVADPGQATPIDDKQPGERAKLVEAVKAWRQEMFGPDAAASDTRSKGKRAGQRMESPNAVDPRPIPVGYREFPITMLPARDGEPRGGVKRSSNAPNCSYFVHWTSLEGSMVWLLDVHTSGRYQVSIDYTCPLADAGSTVELSFQNSRLTGKVAPGWDPPLYTNQDTLPRVSGESQMKEFHTLQLGEMDLASGQGPLTLRALAIPGASVMDVRRLTLTLMP